jgi:hypothetical protein
VPEDRADVGDARARAQQPGRARVAQRVRVTELAAIFASAPRRLITAASAGSPQRRPTLA